MQSCEPHCRILPIKHNDVMCRGRGRRTVPLGMWAHDEITLQSAAAVPNKFFELVSWAMHRSFFSTLILGTSWSCIQRRTRTYWTTWSPLWSSSASASVVCHALRYACCIFLYPFLVPSWHLLVAQTVHLHYRKLNSIYYSCTHQPSHFSTSVLRKRNRLALE